MKNCLGIEIGNYRIKIAYMEKGVLREYISERIEEGAKPDARLCAETIRDLLAQKMIRCKKAVFVLRQEDSYVKKFKLPFMTTEQLKLNLPYEFQDYIGERLDAFQYDYAMIDRTDDGMELLAAACRKELCQQFEKIAKLAKLKIVGIVPSAIGLERILERAFHGEKKDFAVLDLRTRAVMVHFFNDGIYEITRTMEIGCMEIEKIWNRDPEMIRELGLDPDESAWDENDKKNLKSTLDERYRSIGIQIMRVLNFYSFNNTDNTIDTLYYCGGGARFKELIDAIQANLDLPVKSLGELAPEVDLEKMPEWLDSPQTYGVLLA